jgi:hypothetical protein
LKKGKALDRLWFACAFVKFRAPELSLSKWKYSILKTKPMSEKDARNEMWCMRQNVVSDAWLFWLEPDSMSESEKQKYIPLDVRLSTGVTVFPES